MHNCIGHLKRFIIIIIIIIVFVAIIATIIIIFFTIFTLFLPEVHYDPSGDIIVIN